MHAFAATARARRASGADLVDPFFASMRMDLEPRVAHPGELRALRLRLGRGGRADVPAGLPRRADGAATRRDYDRLGAGARRLGAAFQKINFLRDLAEDHDALGRSYFPGLDVDAFTTPTATAILDDIDADLGAAAAAMPELPAEQPPGRRAAHATVRRARPPAPRDAGRGRSGAPRVRVPTPVKLRLCRRAPRRPRVTLARRGSADARRRVRAAGTGVPRRVVVVGGGIAGLATAALLARDGHASTCWRSTTSSAAVPAAWSATASASTPAPSWYLMPEVFDHFFGLLGTTAEAELDLDALDPGYRVFFEGHDEPARHRPDRGRTTARSSSALEPGAGARLDAYLALGATRPTNGRCAASSTRSFDSTAPLAAPATSCAGAPALGRLLTQSLEQPRRRARSPTTGCARSSATRRCSSAPRPTGRRACTT